jgi:hypothetical protein
MRHSLPDEPRRPGINGSFDRGHCENEKGEHHPIGGWKGAGIYSATTPPAKRYSLCTIPDIRRNSAFKFKFVGGRFCQERDKFRMDQTPYNYGAVLFVGHRTDSSTLPTLV